VAIVGATTFESRRSARCRESSKRETITFDAQSITIRRRSQAGEHFLVFPRHGSKVKLHAPSEDERRSLAARLKQLVGNANEPPAL
jgi:hypothetical protein